MKTTGCELSKSNRAAMLGGLLLAPLVCACSDLTGQDGEDALHGSDLLPLAAGNSAETQVGLTVTITVSGNVAAPGVKIPMDMNLEISSSGTESCTVTGTDSSTFPEEVWTLRCVEKTTDTTKSRVVVQGEEMSDTETETDATTTLYYLASDDRGVRYWGSRDEDDTEIGKLPTAALILPATVETGSTWTTDPIPGAEDGDSSGSQSNNAAGRETVVVPLGSFQAMKIVSTPQGATLRMEEEDGVLSFAMAEGGEVTWYMEGVGEVKSTISEKGKITIESPDFKGAGTFSLDGLSELASSSRFSGAPPRPPSSHGQTALGPVASIRASGLLERCAWKVFVSLPTQPIQPRP